MEAPLDTIAALATARGAAALAIVRMSGPRAVEIADRLFPVKTLAEAPSHTVHVGYLESLSGELLDQVVVTLFRAPRSATGEDVVEVTCHGGDVAPQVVLRALFEAGARLARPGEFTERAFLAGKLDLAQAEAVADLIHAQSALAHRVSLNHLEGRYSDELAALRQEILDLAALVELELDFAEEDVELADPARLEELIGRGERMLDRLAGSYRLGALLRDGVRVVIGGRPNAGKSTLLNALVGYDRAIVSEVPGTTRDAIEAEVEISGLRFRFLDTAGLRETEDLIEAEGVRRSERAATQADLLLYVFDASLGLDAGERDWLERFTVKHPGLPLILLANKADLPEQGAAVPGDALLVSAQDALSDPDTLHPLYDQLTAFVRDELSHAESSAVVTSERHRQHLERARAALGRARDVLALGASGDLIAVDLRTVLYEIGAVTGEVTSDDVLGAIFSRFCIGK